MSYTNWNSFERILEEDDFNYLIKLDDKTKDKITGLLPFPIKEWKDVEPKFTDSFIYTVESAILTLKIVDEIVDNPYEFPITELPDRINYVGSFSNKYDEKWNSYLNVVAISFKDLLNGLKKDWKKKSLDLLIVNPNIARLLKLIYGGTINNVNSHIRRCGFSGHITDNHTELFKKNIGKSYIKSGLSDAEREAVGNWTTYTDIVNLASIVRNIAPNLNLNITEKNYTIFWLLKMYAEIIDTEMNKDLLTGYEYKAEEDLKIDIDTLPVKEYLLENMSEYAKLHLNVDNDLLGILDEIDCSYVDNHDLKVELDLIAVKTLAEMYKENAKFGWARKPSKYKYFVSKNNLTYSEAVDVINESLKGDPLFMKCNSEFLTEKGLSIFDEDLLLFDNEEDPNMYDVYKAVFPAKQKKNEIEIKYTSFAEALIKRFNLIDLNTSYLYRKVKDITVEDGALIGEMIVIYTVLKVGLKVPVLKVFKDEDDYLDVMSTYKKPIKELLQLIK